MKVSANTALNSRLPRSFREIRLELAREKDHPEGDRAIGYTLIAPLDNEGRIDAETWQSHREACKVVRRRPSPGISPDSWCIALAVHGRSDTAPANPRERLLSTKSVIILPMNASSRANMSPSRKVRANIHTS